MFIKHRKILWCALQSINTLNTAHMVQISLHTPYSVISFNMWLFFANVVYQKRIFLHMHAFRPLQFHHQQAWGFSFIFNFCASNHQLRTASYHCLQCAVHSFHASTNECLAIFDNFFSNMFLCFRPQHLRSWHFIIIFSMWYAVLEFCNAVFRF